MEVLIVIVLWLIGLYVVASIAESKGFSVWGYFFFALVFSPLIAGIFALVMPANKQGQEARQLKEGKAKKCPRCAELVKNEANICKFCGLELVGQD